MNTIEGPTHGSGERRETRLPPLYYGDTRTDPRLQNGDGRPHYTPWISLDHDDPLTPTGVFWLSPDIWVVSSLGLNLPREGEPNRVFARVHNRGLMDAVNVNVLFCWAEPSGAITDALAYPIGGDRLAATRGGVFIPAAASVAVDSVVVVECPLPWYPVHLGHECLVVKAWCPGSDPASAPFEPALDAVFDHHSAQHNVNVQLLAAGAPFQLAVMLANPTRFALEVRADVRLLSTARLQAVLKTVQAPRQYRLQPMAGGMPLAARWSDDRHGQMERDGALAHWLAAEDDPRTRATACVPHDASRTLTTLADRYAPWERRAVQLEGRVPRDAPAGAVFGVEVVQRLGDLVVGGYVALAIVQPSHGRRG